MSAPTSTRSSAPMRFVIVGGGVAGSITALLLHRAGHDVVILDPAHPAHQNPKTRPSPHLQQSHVFLAQMRTLFAAHLPDVLAAWQSSGGRDVPAIDQFADTVGERATHQNDDALTQIASSRQLLNRVLAAFIAKEAIDVLNVSAADVVTADDGLATGVRDDAGGIHAADVVIDAAGKRSPLLHYSDEDSQAVGLMYATQFYDGQQPMSHGMRFGSSDGIHWAVFPAEHGRRSVTFTFPIGDPDGPALRTTAGHATATRAVAPLSDAVQGTVAVGDVILCAGFRHAWNPRRRHGIVAVGDSAASTNPLWGRGCTTATIAAVELASLVVAGCHRAELSDRLADRLEDVLLPHVNASRLADQAARAGRTPGGPLADAALSDPTAARALLAGINMTEPTVTGREVRRSLQHAQDVTRPTYLLRNALTEQAAR